MPSPILKATFLCFIIWCVCVCPGVHIAVRGQLKGIGSSYLGLNSGHLGTSPEGCLIHYTVVSLWNLISSMLFHLFTFSFVSALGFISTVIAKTRVKQPFPVFFSRPTVSGFDQLGVGFYVWLRCLVL